MPPSDDPTLPISHAGPSPEGSTPSSGAGNESSHLAPGTVIGGRYRVVSRVGRGGMGEVYRADDLALSAPVALKFLPKLFASDPARLERLRAEVRLSRQISHPNVCRVFDIAQADGVHFITMELVDGEDLGLLLRRIGRLPMEKAIELTRQLCLGLAAVHELGVVHRDLKPSNILIDGRGRARIADFGIAFPLNDADEQGIGGTPAYMSPEQLLGKSATVRSDIYSLGLVLYEIYSGRPARDAATLLELKRNAESGTRPDGLSTWIPEIEPAIEDAILHCLEPKPDDRPASAIALLSEIPGGDPLRAMADAGMTPSPDVVARAGGRSTVSAQSAVLLLIGALMFLPVVLILQHQHSIHHAARLEKAPAVLLDRARQVAASLAPGSPVNDSVSGGRFLGFDHRRAVNHEAGTAALSPPARERRIRESLEREHPASFEMWFRFSREPVLLNRVRTSRLAALPAMSEGDSTLALSQSGRLLWFRARPVPRADATPQAPPPDPVPIFDAAGLDFKAFTPAEPEHRPTDVGFDSRSAWVGRYPGLPELPLRVEIASLAGQLTSFRLVRPWEAANAAAPTSIDESRRRLTSELARYAYAAVFVISAIAAVIVAYRQLRKRRGDLAGATRLAAVMFLLQLVIWVVGTHHVADPYSELALFMEGLGEALATALVAFALYLAFEPFIRKRQSVVLISWSRLLAGRWDDALVARDVLLGLAFATLFKASELVWKTDFTHPLAPSSGLRGQPSVDSMLSLSGAVQSIAYCANEGITDAMLTLLGTVFICWVLGHRAAGAVVATLCLAAVSAQVFSGVGDIKSLAAVLCFSGLSIFLALRVGLLALVVSFAAAFLLNGTPATLDLSAWYAPSFQLQVVALFALAALAFRNIMTRRPDFPTRRSGSVWLHADSTQRSRPRESLP